MRSLLNAVSNLIRRKHSIGGRKPLCLWTFGRFGVSYSCFCHPSQTTSPVGLCLFDRDLNLTLEKYLVYRKHFPVGHCLFYRDVNLTLEKYLVYRKPNFLKDLVFFFARFSTASLTLGNCLVFTTMPPSFPWAWSEENLVLCVDLVIPRSEKCGSSSFLWTQSFLVSFGTEPLKRFS